MGPPHDRAEKSLTASAKKWSEDRSRFSTVADLERARVHEELADTTFGAQERLRWDRRARREVAPSHPAAECDDLLLGPQHDTLG